MNWMDMSVREFQAALASSSPTLVAVQPPPFRWVKRLLLPLWFAT